MDIFFFTCKKYYPFKSILCFLLHISLSLPVEQNSAGEYEGYQ